MNEIHPVRSKSTQGDSSTRLLSKATSIGIQILIVDYGSQYTLVIGRTLRELGVRSAILPPEKASSWLKMNNPKAVILSGSNFSVHNDGAPTLPADFDISGKFIEK